MLQNCANTDESRRQNPGPQPSAEAAAAHGDASDGAGHESGTPAPAPTPTPTPTPGADSNFALYQQQRLLKHQRERVQVAADRLERQADPTLRRGLANELQMQQGLLQGLSEGLERLREQARKDFELARTRAYLDGLAADRARSVAGEERRALIAEVRARMRRGG